MAKFVSTKNEKSQKMLCPAFGLKEFKSKAWYHAILAIQKGKNFLKVWIIFMIINDYIFMCHPPRSDMTLMFLSSIIPETSTLIIIILPTILLCE